MISIYFRPDCTQIVQAVIQKDLSLKINDYAIVDDALEYIISDGAGEDAKLGRFFQQLKKEVDVAGDDVYIVLPDYIFSFIDSIESINDANLKSIIQEHTNEPAENIYYKMPVITTSPAPERKSVYAIKKKYIDKLVKIAMQERIAITSVEAASLSFFRAYSDWHNEMPVVEIFPENASIITYSPAGGIFITDTPALSEKKLREASNNADSLVSTAYAANDYSAGETFMNINTDMPYYVISDQKNILSLPAVVQRNPRKKLAFPEYINASIIPKAEHSLWMPVVGTILQAYDDLPEKFQADNPVYENKDAFITVQSGNLLPESAMKAAKNRQWKRVVQRICKRLCIAFSTAIVLETASILYFSSISINPLLEQDYQVAQKDIEEIQNEVAVINTAHSQNQYAVEAFCKLVQSRPDGVGFTDIKIGNPSPETAKDEKNNLKYIAVTAVAADPMIFQTFRSNLNNIDIFTTPSIDSIASFGSNGFQKANLSIGMKNNNGGDGK